MHRPCVSVIRKKQAFVRLENVLILEGGAFAAGVSLFSPRPVTRYFSVE